VTFGLGDGAIANHFQQASNFMLLPTLSVPFGVSFLFSMLYFLHMGIKSALFSVFFFLILSTVDII
jgi:hypothetical protein